MIEEYSEIMEASAAHSSRNPNNIALQTGRKARKCFGAEIAADETKFEFSFT